MYLFNCSIYRLSHAKKGEEDFLKEDKVILLKDLRDLKKKIPKYLRPDKEGELNKEI